MNEDEAIESMVSEGGPVYLEHGVAVKQPCDDAVKLDGRSDNENEEKDECPKENSM